MSSPVWKGKVSFGDLEFPAQLFSGPRPISFELSKVHKSCSRKIKWSPRCDCLPRATIPWEDIGQGFAEGAGFKLLDEADIEAAKGVPSEILAITSFAHGLEIQPLYFESAYYVAPREEGESVYAALWLALTRGYVGLGKFVLRSRDRCFLIGAGRSGLILHTLFFEDEANRLGEFRTNTDAANLALRKRVKGMVFRSLGAFDPAGETDEYRARMEKLVKGESK